VSVSAWIQSAVTELKVWREWDVHAYPAWLVLEVEGRLQIRPKQYCIACKLTDANCGGSIVQLNMGEGKTRTVLPMVWLHQSRDGKYLVRANFLSALLPEAREYLEHNFSASVLRRRLYELPFHRDVDLVPRNIARINACLAQCMHTGGLLMVAPEHRNSLTLKAVEWHLSQHVSHQKLLAGLDVMLQKYKVFDILDESDMILNHLYQLVYAYGAPCALPGDVIAVCIYTCVCLLCCTYVYVYGIPCALLHCACIHVCACCVLYICLRVWRPACSAR
jgi:hypothetical protein